MGQRFGDLRRVYLSLKSANFDFSTLPVNNRYRKYAEYVEDVDGERPESYGPVPEQGRRKKVGIKAFGLDDGGAAEDKILVKMSGRAYTQFSGISAKAKFNVDEAPDNTYQDLSGFTPAKAHVVTIAAATTKRSEITGIRYKSRSGNSITVPYGKGTTAVLSRDIEVQENILADATIISTYMISFTPERISRNG